MAAHIKPSRVLEDPYLSLYQLCFKGHEKNYKEPKEWSKTCPAYEPCQCVNCSWGVYAGSPSRAGVGRLFL